MKERRLIDADEIEWHDHFDSDGNKTKYKVAYSDEMPPTVDAVPQWIPVEKEMPKKEGEYLVSDKYGGVFIAALFLRDNKGRPISPVWYIERSWALDVIAWAEIPTPYRVEDKR